MPGVPLVYPPAVKSGTLKPGFPHHHPVTFAAGYQVWPGQIRLRFIRPMYGP